MVSSICARIWATRPSIADFSPAPSTIGGLVLGDGDLAGLAEHVEADVLELHAEFLGDDLAAGQDRDVLQHRLAAIAEARRLHGRDLEPAAQLVDDQGGQGLALDVFGDDQQRLARLDDQLEQRHHRLQRTELLLVDQDDRILELGDHLVGVGDEVGAEVAAVELHAIDDLGLGHEALVLLDGDDTLVADLLHRLGDLPADLGLAVRGDRADLADLLRPRDGPGLRLDVLDDDRDGLLDAALQVHRVHAGRDRLHAFLDDRLGEDRGGGGAVAGLVAGAAGHFADHLRAHVLELVLELDLLGDGDAVLGDARRAPGLGEDHVAALGAEGDAHRVGECVHALQHAVTRVGVESQLLGGHRLVLLGVSEMGFWRRRGSGGLLGRARRPG